jgi:hypothetical protein
MSGSSAATANAHGPAAPPPAGGQPPAAPQAYVSYRAASCDPAVEKALKAENIFHLLAPLQMYERTAKLTVANFLELGGIFRGAQRFCDDRTAYIKKLVVVDGLVAPGERVLDGLTSAAEDDLVHALFSAVAACEPDASNRHGSSVAGGTLGDELVEAITKTKPSTVKRSDVFSIMSRGSDFGIDMPVGEDMRPGHGVLGLAKDSLTPAKPKAAWGVMSPISTPVLDLRKVDTQGGGLVFPEKGEPAAATVVAAYKVALLAQLLTAFDTTCPASHHPYARGEHEGYTPSGGHRLLDEESMKIHLSPIERALAGGKVPAAAFITILETTSKNVRELVAGGGDKYQRKLSPSAALRAVVPDLRVHLDGAAEGTAEGKTPASGGKRGDEPRTEAQLAKAESKRTAKAARKLFGKGGGGVAPAYGKGQPGAFGGQHPCRDFAKGSCTYGAKCKFSHAAPVQAVAPVGPPAGAPPPMPYWMYPPPMGPPIPGPHPPPGLPPARF